MQDMLWKGHIPHFLCIDFHSSCEGKGVVAEMMELVKNNIHMNRQRTAVSQITLDDDFIVPDTMDDVYRLSSWKRGHSDRIFKDTGR